MQSSQDMADSNLNNDRVTDLKLNVPPLFFVDIFRNVSEN